MAGTTTSKRVSIKDFHVPYLAEIGQQIGTSDLSEIVNYLICQVKAGNFTPIAQMPNQPARSTTAIATDDDLADSLAGILEG